MFHRSFQTLSAVGISIALLLVVVGVAARTNLADAAPARAEDSTPREIIVSGTGRVSVQPDQAILSLGVQFTASTLDEATRQANDAMTRVVAAVQAQGVTREDIQTSSYNITPLNRYQEGQAPVITGYQVTNIVNVRVRQSANVGSVLDAALGAGANSFNGISWSAADPTSAEAQARALAVQDATHTAQVLAQAAGVSLGRVVSIQENVSQAPRPVPYARGAATSNKVPVESGTLDVTTTVEMHFLIP